MLIVAIWIAVIVNGKHDKLLNDYVDLTVKAQYLQTAVGSLQGELSALKTIAVHDKLTGLLNRHGFDFESRKIFAVMTGKNGEPERRKDPIKSIGVLFIDLDHFKKINDSHGHDVGDSILHQAAKLIYDSCRIGDLVCRWGGEEFVLALPNISSNRLRALAEEIRLGVEEGKFIKGLKITASIGFAYSIDKNISLEKLIKSADEALYKAKESGRNRVVGGTVF